MSMENKITGNEPAKPIGHGLNYNESGVVVDSTNGLTIRQHIAIEAMKGLCANAGVVELANALVDAGLSPSISELIAEKSMSYADAMIAQFNKPQP